MAHLWGIDLGGTKIEGVILPSETEVTPIARLRIPTEADQGYEHIVSRIQQVIEMLERQSGIERPERIGIGTPGTVDPPTGLMKNCNTTVLNHHPLDRDLKALVGSDFVIANDANCFALAESRLGSAKGASVVFGVIMGTGVGGGLVVDGKVIGGAQGIGGEWGHNVLEPGGKQCYCGKRGCVETVLSGPNLEAFYAQQSGTAKRLHEIVTSDEPAAQATIDRLVTRFGEAISVLVNIVDPDAIVLGGGVGNIDALYTQGRDELAKWVFNNSLETKILRPTLGDSAGVFGAAMLTSR